MWIFLMILSVCIFYNTQDVKCLIVIGLCLIASAIHRLCDVIKSYTDNSINFSIKNEKDDEDK